MINGKMPQRKKGAIKDRPARALQWSFIKVLSHDQISHI